MPELTRRRSADHRHNCWHIYYGDVHVGTVAERVGNPHDTDPWEWSLRFCPGSASRFSVVSQFEFPLPTQTILQPPHGRSILALQGQAGARDAQ